MDKVREKWTVIELIKWGSEFFTNKNIDSPRLTIELMLCHILGCSRIQLYSNFDKPINNYELEILRSFVKRRLKHEPLQYILGETNFFGLTLQVDNSSIIPRPETELIVEAILKDFPNKKERYKILDIGTGSGCLSIALAYYYPESDVYAIDNSMQSLKLAEKNAFNLKIKNIKFEKCDILREIPKEEDFDIICSNPPYIPLDEYYKTQDEVQLFEPKTALTDLADGLTFYRRFASIFSNILKEEGKFFLEIGYCQSVDIKKIFSEFGFNVSFINDLSGIQRIVTNS